MKGFEEGGISESRNLPLDESRTRWDRKAYIVISSVVIKALSRWSIILLSKILRQELQNAEI